LLWRVTLPFPLWCLSAFGRTAKW